MEAKFLQCIQPGNWVDTGKLMRKSGGFIRVSHKTTYDSRIQMMCMNVQSNKRTSVYHKPLRWQISSSLKNSQGSLLESGGFPASLDESLVLKNKSEEIEQILDGRCIYLVGMMGSGKTTVGKVMSEVLDYSFYDSDKLLEQKVGGMSVAEIFKQHGEGFFRDKETEALKELSMMHWCVISTGGGAVIRSINWKHMRSGISVWLDVPVDCLARRVTAVGTGSRPLLHDASGDAYSKALTRLSTLLEERGEAYANANARVSLESIASKLGNVKVDNVSPAAIAIEVLEQIESFLKQ